jgi:hypothetical protein
MKPFIYLLVGAGVVVGVFEPQIDRRIENFRVGYAVERCRHAGLEAYERTVVPGLVEYGCRDPR